MDPTPFGRYLLVELLAHGGMAQVYRAVLRGGPGFEKHVALKRVLRQFSEDPEFIARFADEAGIASTLSHSNIVQVFDFGSVDGEYFLAMELIDGPDVGTLIEASAANQQPLPMPAALYIAGAMARGLGAAHGRVDQDGAAAPVVHRDVSPQNVLVSRAGEVKVVDFGIAMAAEKALKTRTGMVMGKCRYMAPEQAMGERVDARADVFAAGAVLFEMLTGRALFDGATPQQIIGQVVGGGQIDAPSVFNSSVPPSVDEICVRALAREREYRHPDGTALARELERQLHTLAPGYSGDELAQLVDVLVPRARTLSRPLGVATDVPTDVADIPQTPPPRGPLSSAFSAAALDAPPTVADPLERGPSDIPTDPKGPSLDALRAQAPIDVFASTEAVDRIAGLADALTETGSDAKGKPVADGESVTVLVDTPDGSGAAAAGAAGATAAGPAREPNVVLLDQRRDSSSHPTGPRPRAAALAQTAQTSASGGGARGGATWLLVVAAVLLGGGAGVGARVLGSPASATARGAATTRAATRAQPLTHGPWRLTVHDVRDAPRGVVVDLELAGRDATPALGAQLALARGDGAAVRARFWRVEHGGRWTVGFDRPAGSGKLVLLASLPGAKPLRVVLP